MARRVPAPVRDDESGCLLFQGYRDPVTGYGKTGKKVDGRWKTTYVHIVAYERAFGPVPEGHQVDHVATRGCRHRHCIEPSHLEAVPQAENIRRQPNVIRQMQATHCPHGHPYDEKNTWIRKRGAGVKRECYTCHYARVARNRAKKKV